MTVIKSFGELSYSIKTFIFITLLNCFYSIYFSLSFLKITLFGLTVSFLTIPIICIYLLNVPKMKKKWIYEEIIYVILMILSVFHFFSLYLASFRINFSKNYLMDESLINADDYLLGKFFIRGQLSLSTDKHPYLAPNKPIGIIINNILQICYVLFYVMPYFSVYPNFLYIIGKEFYFRYKNNGKKSSNYQKNINRIFFILSVYVFTCGTNFLLNTFIPASSPRLYLKDSYTTELELYGPSKFINGLCKDNKSANSFPSGHVSDVYCISLAYYGIKYYIPYYLILLSTVLIAISTLFLRYHYFVDLIFGCVVSYVAYYLVFNYGYKKDLVDDSEKKDN